ncbi:hypothetical protein HanOQP8_Chr10g0358421 [Helianthus annuus]|nr:hypothetical protein HanOQP8_Chr10g0358421 [Helianthus annuus]KAJ0882996.1 hypothetical protein HanPSC8_Chr10g0416141 [Helianthus annuus]
MMTNFAYLANLPNTKERITAFWAIDSTIRTFKPRIKDSVENFSTSYTMLSAPRSASKLAYKFGLDDIDSMISPHSIKRELARGQSLPEPKIVTTRKKAGSKQKKPSEPEEDKFEDERKIHEFVTKRFVRLKAHQDKSLAKAEENLAGLRSIVAAKDKSISKLEKDVKGLEKKILMAEIQANKANMEATDEGKVYAARTILQARIKIAQEAMDPGFDRST